MGVQARIVLWAPDSATALKAAAAALERLAVLDSLFSDWRDDGEVRYLEAAAGGPPVPASPEMIRVLQHARQLSRATSGAFDVTVGVMTRLWREARRTGRLPAMPALQAARPLVDWRLIELDPGAGTVRLGQAGMQLDFGGIAKGFGVDQAGEILRQHGVASALVELGGDLAVSGPPPGQDGWVIAGLEGEGPLANVAVSTSGSEVQAVRIGEYLISHVINPRTGWPLGRPHGVTVIASWGLLADPLATAFGILGPGASEAVADRYGSAVRVRWRVPAD